MEEIRVPSRLTPTTRKAMDSQNTSDQFPVRLTTDSGLVASTPVAASNASLLWTHAARAHPQFLLPDRP